MTLRMILLTILLLTAATAANADVNPIDLSGWTATTLDLPGGQSAGNWVVQSGGTSVLQTRNSDPSFFTNGLNLAEYTMLGTWQAHSTSDDDFMGFTFGYADGAHCYIFDWKKGFQNAYGTAEEGMSVKKIEAPSVGDLTNDDFWASAGTENSTVLASNWGSSTGYAFNTIYEFSLTMNIGSFTIVIRQDDVVLWDVTISDGTYVGGEFGFYNFSQANIEYSGFTQNTPPVCLAGGPYEGGAGEPVVFDGSGCFDEDGDIVLWEWDFGDGNTGTGMTPSHIYAEDGIYEVQLCVTDNEGLRRCCEPDGPTVESDDMSWDQLKSLYR